MLEENALRAAGHRERQPKRSRSSVDYHDWQMLQLERTAEQRLREASLIAVRGELAARNEVQRYKIILDNIRRLRITPARKHESATPAELSSTRVSAEECARTEGNTGAKVQDHTF